MKIKVSALVLIVLCILCSCKKAEQPKPLVSIVDYKIVMQKDVNAMTKTAISKMVYGITVDGRHPAATHDGTEETEYEVIIGFTKRPESSEFINDLGPLDYTIRVEDNGKVVVSGGSEYAVLSAVDCFKELVDDGTMLYPNPGYSYTYIFYEHHEHDSLSDLNGPEAKALIEDWYATKTSPDWGGFDKDIEESIYALTHKYVEADGVGRVALYAHRGDMSNYPENSIGGMISAILSGADSLELDYRITKDHVPVVFHDQNLYRMTNFDDVAGKNGLPKSMMLEDWTYDELCQLRLKDYYGNVTDYKIPSVFDALLVAGNHVQVFFDDKANADVTYERTLIPMAVGAGAANSMVFTVGRSMKSLELLRGYADDSLLDFAEQCMKTGSFTSVYAFYNDSTVFSDWNSSFESLNEGPDYWQTLLDRGKRYIGTNQCYKFSLFMRDKEMKLWK